MIYYNKTINRYNIMNKFDEIYTSIVGEAVAPTPGYTSATPQQPTVNQQVKPQQPITPTVTNTKDDQELLNLLKQKLNDAKFKDALMKIVNAPNTGAPQTSNTSV